MLGKENLHKICLIIINLEVVRGQHWNKDIPLCLCSEAESVEQRGYCCLVQ